MALKMAQDEIILISILNYIEMIQNLYIKFMKEMIENISYFITQSVNNFGIG